MDCYLQKINKYYLMFAKAVNFVFYCIGQLKKKWTKCMCQNMNVLFILRKLVAC